MIQNEHDLKTRLLALLGRKDYRPLDQTEIEANDSLESLDTEERSACHGSDDVPKSSRRRVEDEIFSCKKALRVA